MDAATLHLRCAAPGDACAVATLLRPLAQAFIVDPRSDEAAPFWASVNEAAQRRYIAADRYQYTLAFEPDGALAGFIALRDGRHLFHLFVAPAWQRQGLATRLWRHASAQALAVPGLPLPAVFTLNASVPAVGFYQRLGFQVEGSALVANGIAFQPMRLAAPDEVGPGYVDCPPGRSTTGAAP